MNDDQKRVLQELLKRKKRKWVFDSLEDLIVSPHGFALTTATPLQRAICRIVEGRPLGDLKNHPHVRQSLGDCESIDGIQPSRLVMVAGIRTFKSLLAAAMGIYVSQTCDVSKLGPGEIPRFSIVSVKLDLAKVIFKHLVGNTMARPELKKLMVGEPTSDTVNYLHPDGCIVEVKTVAGSRAGASLVARWSAGVVFDEAPRMVGSSEGVINLDDARSAVMGRLLPGAQIMEIGSPWAAMGPVYDTVTAHWGAPTREVTVIKARANWLNPVWWTDDRIAELRQSDPIAYKTDVLAEFADVEEALIPGLVVEDSVQDYDYLPWQAGHDYVAAMDPAMRGDAWTLVVCDRIGHTKRVVFAKEWQGTPDCPTNPKEVLQDIAKVLQSYMLNWCFTDQYSADALISLAEDYGLHLLCEDWTAQNKMECFMNLRAAITAGEVHVLNNRQVIKDLKIIKKRVTQAGGINIIFPRTPDGRHADYAPAIARALNKWLNEPEYVPTDDEERANIEAERRQQRAAMQLDEKTNNPWWANDVF